MTVDYTIGDFRAYANYSLIHAVGEDWVSSQFSFDPSQLAYVQDHYINLDHEILGTGSAGMSYKWGNTIISSDLLYATGLREDLTLPSGYVIPNGTHTAAYVTVNLGLSHDLTDIGWKGMTARATSSTRSISTTRSATEVASASLHRNTVQGAGNLFGLSQSL